MKKTIPTFDVALNGYFTELAEERNNIDPSMVMLEDAARMLGINCKKICALMKSGELPSVRLKYVICIPRDALHRWIEKQTT